MSDHVIESHSTPWYDHAGTYPQKREGTAEPFSR